MALVARRTNLLLNQCASRNGANFGLNTQMWDTKRQIVWLAAGISFGTWIVYVDSRDDMGKFDPEVFVFWELVLLAIIGALFYLYSRKKRQ